MPKKGERRPTTRARENVSSALSSFRRAIQAHKQAVQWLEIAATKLQLAENILTDRDDRTGKSDPSKRRARR